MDIPHFVFNVTIRNKPTCSNLFQFRTLHQKLQCSISTRIIGWLLLNHFSPSLFQVLLVCIIHRASLTSDLVRSFSRTKVQRCVYAKQRNNIYHVRSPFFLMPQSFLRLSKILLITGYPFIILRTQCITLYFNGSNGLGAGSIIAPVISHPFVCILPHFAHFTGIE